MGGEGIRLATDFRDLLRVFVAHDVRFLVVGAYALAVLGRPRATGDLDVWIDARPANAKRALALPPLRIDILTARARGLSREQARYGTPRGPRGRGAPRVAPSRQATNPR